MDVFPKFSVDTTRPAQFGQVGLNCNCKRHTMYGAGQSERAIGCFVLPETSLLSIGLLYLLSLRDLWLSIFRSNWRIEAKSGNSQSSWLYCSIQKGKSNNVCMGDKRETVKCKLKARLLTILHFCWFQERICDQDSVPSVSSINRIVRNKVLN